VDVLRTPDDRFAELPDFPYAARYVEVADGEDGRLRVAYLDEGPPEWQTVLLLHGEPSWSFLYRTMVPASLAAGLRVIAPDLVGFGRSDKPAHRADYTYARHVEWMRQALLDEIDLDGATVVGQDWGGLIGLRIVAEHPDRFSRVVVANTGLPTGEHPSSDAFLAWQRYSSTPPISRWAASCPVGAELRCRPRCAPLTTHRFPTTPNVRLDPARHAEGTRRSVSGAGLFLCR
jgi:haloalkane dehalogenase